MREKLVFNGFSLNIGKEKLKCFAEFSGEKSFSKQTYFKYVPPKF